MTGSSIAQLKSVLRQRVRGLRQEISPSQRLILDKAISAELLKFLKKLKVSSVSAYWPFDGEPDTRAALDSMYQYGSLIALPVLSEKKPSTISMFQWTPDSIMKRNAFGIPEPLDEPAIDVDELDCMLIPLVAWDRFGGRLGMGGGYYDRILAPVKNSQQPMRIGLAYSLQEVDRVPVNQNDVGLHGVICEHGWIPAKP